MRAFLRFRLFQRGPLAALLCAGLSTACHEKPKPLPNPAGSSSAAPPGKLTIELARQVLVKVGEREITLGDYAETLERMDPFERLRYQSPDRRKQLLNEIIQVELLAEEAKRRGLDA
jgi:peptidyl-prolyl cis-trans isomerase C